MKTMNIKQRSFLMRIFAFLASVLLVIGFAVLTPTTAKAESAKVKMLEGASIRYAEPAGIRFTAYVNDSCFVEGDTLNEGVTVGMTLTATDSTGASKNWDIDSATTTLTWATSDLDGYHMFQVALADKEAFPESEYATEITAQAYVTDSTGTEKAEAQTRSIAQVANACLAENEMLKAIESSETLATEKASTLDVYTEATAALAGVTASTIALENNAFTWGAVENAKGYFVAYNGKVVQVTSGTSVPVSAFGELDETKGEVSVIAYGDGKTATYGEVVSNNVLVNTNTLIDFNTADSVNSVVAGHPDTEHSSIKTTFHTGPNHDATVGNGGAVYIRLNPSTIGNGAYSSIFAINLSEGLDLTKGDGISITIAVTFISSNNGTNAQLAVGQVGHPGSASNYVNRPETDESKQIAIPTDESINFVTIKFTMDELKALDYTDGRTTITFCLWQNTEAPYGGTAGVWLDDISYYTEGES